MSTFTIRHTFDIDEETFWSRCFLDNEFNRKLYVERLQFTGYEVLEEKKEESGKIRKKVKATPKADMPKPIQKLFGSDSSYVEEGTFDGRRYVFRITPSKMADKITIGGEMWCDKRGDKKVERSVRIDVNVRIFGVGGIVESFI